MSTPSADILRKAEQVIRDIGQFLGYTVTEEEVKEVKEKIQFNNMKQVTASVVVVVVHTGVVLTDI